MSMWNKFVRVTQSVVADFSEVWSNRNRKGIEAFKDTWKHISNWIVHCEQHDGTSLENSSFRQMLTQLVDILSDEEIELSGDAGACMEYFYSNEILQMLINLGIDNSPQGARIFVVYFVTQLFQKIKQPLLPSQKVFPNIKRFLGSLRGTLVAAADSDGTGEETHPKLAFAVAKLVCILCTKLKEEPHFTPLLIETTTDDSGTTKQDFLLFSVALHLLEEPSYDQETSRLAHEATRDCCEMQSMEAARIIASTRALPDSIMQTLTTLLGALPRRAADFTDDYNRYFSTWITKPPPIKWQDSALMDSKYPATVAPLAKFLAEISFLDDICIRASDIISEVLASEFNLAFLKPLFEEKLLAGSEEEVEILTSYLTLLLTLLRSSHLIDAIARFALSDTLMQTFISRCDDMSDELSIATMHFFTALLKRGHEYVFTRIIRSHLVTDKEWEGPLTAKQITNFLADLVPTQLVTSSDQNASRRYFERALTKMLSTSRECSKWTTSLEQRKGEKAPGRSDGVHDVYDSPFVALLLSRLSRMYSQGIAINSLVTGLMARLLEFPAHSLRAFILSNHKNALLPILQKLKEEMEQAYVSTEQMEEKLRLVRSSMEGEDDDDQVFMFNDEDHVELYQGVILVEEFAKELSAIVLVSANPVTLEFASA